MSLLNTIEIIKKEVYRDSIVLLKIGIFYNVYFKDAIIISHLFGYKLKKVEREIDNCGFPDSSLENVKFLLNQKKINYIIIDNVHNYDEMELKKFDEENNYFKCYEIAEKSILLKRRIENINITLMKNIENNNIESVLEEIEKIIVL